MQPNMDPCRIAMLLLADCDTSGFGSVTSGKFLHSEVVTEGIQYHKLRVVEVQKAEHVSPPPRGGIHPTCFVTGELLIFLAYF